MVERLCKNVEDGTCPMSPSEWKGLELKRRTTNDSSTLFVQYRIFVMDSIHDSLVENIRTGNRC